VDVAAKIAAGEVVERPASVVKELVENALDAGARAIRVELEGGGLDLIRVVDDGAGIPTDELTLAFERHATSKIGTIADLERIHTLGFRGEALASVAAVARVTLASRARGAASGAQVTVDEGRVGAAVPSGAPTGTNISVRGLFASVPARLKFLKTRATETGHAVRIVEQYALAWPGVRFTALSEGREIFHTVGDGSLLNVIIAVHGLRVAQEMVPIGEAAFGESAMDGATAVDRPRVSGYVSRPTTYKATRQYMSFFVNHRWAQSRSLSYAVEEAYHSLLLVGRHPIAVINLAIDPWLLDVNAHPAKTEIKFLRERQVYAAVLRTTRAAVIETAATPEVSTRVFAPMGWEPEARSDTAVSRWSSPDSNSASAELLASTADEIDEQPGDTPVPHSAPGASSTRSDEIPAPTPPWHEERAQIATPYQPSLPGAGVATDPVGRRLSGFSAPSAPAANTPVGGKRLPALRVLGQVSQAYIIAEGPDGVYMVDQHAAHERIILERLIGEWRARAVAAQALLEPEPLDLTPADRERIEEHLDVLGAIGFEIEPFGIDALLVRAVPAALVGKLRGQSLSDLLVTLAGADSEAASHGETWEEHALANVACKAAIKAGQSLPPDEQRELIRQLEGASAFQSCCHGRPTLVKMSLSALEREFDRR
jgi:DNA mismatch repair protein MutL